MGSKRVTHNWIHTNTYIAEIKKVRHFLILNSGKVLFIYLKWTITVSIHLLCYLQIWGLKGIPQYDDKEWASNLIVVATHNELFCSPRFQHFSLWLSTGCAIQLWIHYIYSLWCFLTFLSMQINVVFEFKKLSVIMPWNIFLYLSFSLLLWSIHYWCFATFTGVQ